VTRAGAQHGADLVERGLLGQRLSLGRTLTRSGLTPVVKGVGDALRQVLHLGDDVDEARGQGAARHAVEFGRGRILHQHQPTVLLDGAQPQGAIGAHAREDDADGLLAPVVGQGAEEKVDGPAQAPRGHPFEQMQAVVQDGQVSVGRDDVYTVRLDLQAVPRLGHVHRGGPLQQFGHHAFVVGVEMLDDDEGQAAADGHVAEEVLQGSEATRRGADGDDGESARPQLPVWWQDGISDIPRRVVTLGRSGADWALRCGLGHGRPSLRR
jgi:hypothetical protein